MPLSDDEKQTLFGLLEGAGWSWRDDVIYTPNRSMWLTRQTPWMDDIVDFYERMTLRIERLRKNLIGDNAISDTSSLVEVLVATMQPD